MPEDAALVLVAAPTKDITDAESEKLNAYLDNGGNISLLMSPNGGSFVYTNLEKIMKDYGFYMTTTGFMRQTTTITFPVTPIPFSAN